MPSRHAPLAVALVVAIAAHAPAASAQAAPTAPPPAAAAATPTAAPPAAQVPPPPAAVAPPARPPAEAFSGYLALKGGWFGSSDDYQGESFGGDTTWEISAGSGLGPGHHVGFEFSTGSMTASARNLKVKTVPLLLALRVNIPISMVVPYVELGVGAYFNRFTSSYASASVDSATAGWHTGLGCDVLLGRFLLGAQARYMGIAPTVESIGTVVLDRYQVLLKAGVRF